jgi:uncharacterized protein (DUF983 family)
MKPASARPVSCTRIVTRGLANRCPNCGGKTLFSRGAWFRMNERCAACGFQFQGTGDEGFYLRATSLNFGVTLTCFLFPVLLLAYFKFIGVLTAEVLAFAGALVMPVLLYRSARSWSLMNYYVFCPGELPANGGGAPTGRQD